MAVLPTITTQATEAPPQTDRRRASRLKRKFVSQMTPWAPGVASVPFEVVIEDISDRGVGLIHDQAIPLGLRHLLAVPREDGNSSIIREYNVIRCDARGDGTYGIGLELCIFQGSSSESPRRVTSSRLKLLFLLFGLFGLAVAIFAPL